MLHKLRPDDLLEHSIGGGAPRFTDGTTATPDQIADEGRFFVAGGAGNYFIKGGDDRPLIGTGPNHFYTFHIDAAGVQAIVNRPADQYASTPNEAPSLLNGVDALSGSVLYSEVPPRPANAAPLASSVGDPLAGNMRGVAPDVSAITPPVDPNAKPFFRIPSEDEVHRAFHLERAD
jgi:hypothetical protein